MATLERVHPDSGSQYIRMPNHYGDRAAATQQFDAAVFEETGQWMPPQEPQPTGVLGSGLSAGQVSLLLSVGVIAWRYLL